MKQAPDLPITHFKRVPTDQFWSTSYSQTSLH